MRTDVIDQALAMGLHPAYDCETAIASVSMILCLAQSPDAHTHIAWRGVVENMLEICELNWHKMISEQSWQSQERKMEDPIVVHALKYVTVPILLLYIFFLLSSLRLVHKNYQNKCTRCA